MTKECGNSYTANKARVIVFDKDLFQVELTRQDEFLFITEDAGDGERAGHVMSRANVLALVEWLQAHLGQRAGPDPIEETEDSQGDWQCKDYADGWITFPTRPPQARQP